MSTTEIETARKLLQDRVDRLETSALDSGGICLTAYWRDGSGQTLFYSLDHVREHVETH